MYITLAVVYSIICGFSRLFLGAHSLDQIIFGWMLGVWLALTYFTLIREHVHKHIQDLMTGQTTSRNSIYYMVSTGIFLAFTMIVAITFLVNMNKDIKFPDGVKHNSSKLDDE